MQKLDYLESKVNELLSEISYLSNRCDALEEKVNGTKQISLQSNNKSIDNNNAKN